MGGVPRHALVALAAPGDLPVAWLQGFYRALGRVARRYRIGIVGGGLRANGRDALPFPHASSATPPDARSFAPGPKAGDLVFVTGTARRQHPRQTLSLTHRLAEGQWARFRAPRCTRRST